MKIQDLKLLWGKAAGRCSICKENLILYGETFTIGEMAHIIAKSSTGPRNQNISNHFIDNSYDNLILLCPNHHSEIDKNPENWGIDKLKNIKNEHENWVQEKLESGDIKTYPFEVISQINKILERSELLSRLLLLNIGNSRNLYEMQDDINYHWFQHHDDKSFRDGFLDLIDELYFKDTSNTPPFGFNYSPPVILFPDGFEEYKTQFIKPIKKSKVPLSLKEISIVKDHNKDLLDVKKITPLPNLPLRSGYIAAIDENNGLPSSISDKPSEKYFGAYYWVKPTGLRTTVYGIGVTDPLECYYGIAHWWGLDDARPFIGVQLYQQIKEKSGKELEVYKKKIYSDMIKKFEGKQWNDESKKFE